MGASLLPPPPPRRLGLYLGVRGEVDVPGLSAWLALIPAVSLGGTTQEWEGVATLLVQPSPGLRAEGRWHPVMVSWVRPYVGLGATAFFGQLDNEGKAVFFGGVGGRVALGLDVQVTSRMSVFVDGAYERFFTSQERYRGDAALVSVGVNWFP